jgi:Protein of unknown function (DUF3501)
MKNKIDLRELKNIAEYEKVRERMRAEVIELKKSRRVHVGENLTFLFENRQTVLFQIQEMMRTERIVHEDKIQEEIDAYSALVPGDGEISATLFIEIADLYKMTQAEIHRTVNRFQGLDQDRVALVIGGERVPARFQGTETHEEKMAAVHYLRFPLPQSVRAILADPEAEARIVVDHPNYQAEAGLPGAVRQQLVADLDA